jgi:hypothetical protein
MFLDNWDNDIYTLDCNIDTMMARLDLEGETCHLKHRPEWMEGENPPAVDFLCQHFGDRKSGVTYQELRIPICQECADALYDPNWILAYCINCHKSQWIYRPYSKMAHPEGNGIYWADVCPYCSEIANEWDDKYCED